MVYSAVVVNAGRVVVARAVCKDVCEWVPVSRRYTFDMQHDGTLRHGYKTAGLYISVNSCITAHFIETMLCSMGSVIIYAM